MGKQILNIISILIKIIIVKKIIQFYSRAERFTCTGLLNNKLSLNCNNILRYNGTFCKYWFWLPFYKWIYISRFWSFAQNAAVHKFNKIFPKLIGCAFSLHLFQIAYGSIHTTVWRPIVNSKTVCCVGQVDSCCTSHLILRVF